MKLEPLGHRVLIDPHFESAKTDWGFEMVGDSIERQRSATETGTVLAIGPTAWQNEGLGFTPWCNVGDEVYFAKYAHKVVKDGDKIYFIVNDEDIQCKIMTPVKDFTDE